LTSKQPAFESSRAFCSCRPHRRLY
jgi:hypothetical protein